jgi:DTW domain-containing protein YfiP
VRATCRRCLRPEAFCCCRGLVPVAARTRVVILQHPREARLAICSAWLAHVALAGSELHRGVRFDRDPRARAAIDAPGAALLFPGPGATPVEAVAAPPPVLLVVDGTWPQADKLLRGNPSLAALPRLSLAPARPSGYGELRREPAPGHLSTIEAIAAALGALEGGAERFEPMCEAFRRGVALQLACTRGAARRPRHRPARGLTG